ncbi:related to RPO41-DNA-directed RNA polymerase, mitochondrial [Serendipita indica DSM 11827]|uniref:DNA-directed RNA polymerase, mitochondrial n=1 Tax=Serendipita indica (strain DSM 11827) TaxID=1109443 RepID=G4TLX8_SERID|nr:related to RPO41-DNA-directed RNA polymerase, mitochondrial [Serendipita indica DSM 11827]
MATVKKARQHGSEQDEKMEIRNFLRKRQVVVLPTPMPIGVSYPKSDQHRLFFPESPTLDKLAIMEACLTGFHDVQRAHNLFTDALKDPKLRALLDTSLHNAYLKTYIEYALHEEQNGHNATVWRRRFWDLYASMEEEGYFAQPNTQTYTTMLFGVAHSPDMSREACTEFVSNMMKNMDLREVSLADVIAQYPLDGEAGQKFLEILTEGAKHSGSRAQVMEKLAKIGITPTDQHDVVDTIAELLTRLKVVKMEVDGVKVSKEVFETPFNLETLKSNLEMIVQSRKTIPDDVLLRQKQLEETAYDAALARMKHEAELFEKMQMGTNFNRRSLQAWMWDWQVQTTPYLQERIKELEIEEVEEQARRAKAHRKGEERTPISFFLRLLPPEKLTLICMLELLNMLASGGYEDGARTTRVLLSIGAAIEAEHHFQMAKKHDIPVPDFKSKSELPTYSVAGYLELHKERVKARLELEGRENWMPPWTQEVRARVGAFVADALMEQAKVIQTKVINDVVHEEEQQAFYNAYRYERGFKIGVIKMNDMIIDKLSREPPRERLHARHLPMVVRPRPWLRHNAGGYLYSNLSVMRMKESNEQTSYLREADSRGAMELVYAGLDVLGKTAWKATLAFLLLTSNKRIQIPPLDHTDMRAKADYAVAMKKLALEQAANHSDRCSTNYKMEIARTFLGEKFYLPHNVDFRGRAYPIPPHLNHLGDDLSRGLLLFAEGKPLGKRGIRWLKIHLANLYGYDKATFDDRETFSTEHLEEIYDSAENPLTGRQWWLKADDPWQCLATCMELRNALESPNPEMYESCLPVHQDGTCNGLQHYAALGGDVIGARQVNLDVSDRPSDVYTYVAKMAEAQINKDAEGGHEIAQKLQGRITRKLVKQTVRTSAKYSAETHQTTGHDHWVTFIGARDQIYKQLKTFDDLDGMDLYPWAIYLAKVTLNCIGTLFKGAKDIQLWLNDCARLISKSIPEDRVRLMVMAEQDARRVPGDVKQSISRQWAADKNGGKEQMTTVIWTTLLGLPIVQPYRKAGRKQIMTQLQSVFISDPNQPHSVNTMKQVSAFPPNFVHSLDATHMMLTALQCDRQGLAFAAVHDSYWTHACDIDAMSVAIRDSFVHLHSSNVLENLLEEFKARYQGYKLPISVFKNRNTLKAVGKSEESAELKSRIKLALKEEEEQEVDNEEEAGLGESMEDIGEEPKKSKRSSTKPQEDEEPEKPKTRKPRVKKSMEYVVFNPARERSASELQQIDEEIDHRFVNLVDALPPIPKKGEFNIEVIRNSTYFFS